MVLHTLTSLASELRKPLKNRFLLILIETKDEVAAAIQVRRHEHHLRVGLHPDQRPRRKVRVPQHRDFFEPSGCAELPGEREVILGPETDYLHLVVVISRKLRDVGRLSSTRRSMR